MCAGNPLTVIMRFAFVLDPWRIVVGVLLLAGSPAQ
jgi:hypothetical protein